jgi:peptide/nickel transport system permease protein
LLKSPGFVIGMTLFLGTLVLAFVVPLFMHVDTQTRVGLPYSPPSKAHWLGTDHMGVDMLSMLIAGLRASLHVGFLAGVVASVVGTAVGVYGGYKGGLLDDVLTVVTNLFLVIPSLIVLILLSSSLDEGRSLSLIALIIGCTTWTWSARAVRAQSASLRARDHVNLARINGYGTFGIVVLHILPYLLSYIFMVFIIQTATGILSEASISMLGLGPYDAVSLGKILNDAIRKEALTDGAWWAFVPAMGLVTVIAFSLYVINTSMEGVINPRLRK